MSNGSFLQFNRSAVERGAYFWHGSLYVECLRDGETSGKKNEGALEGLQVLTLLVVSLAQVGQPCSF